MSGRAMSRALFVRRRIDRPGQICDYSHNSWNAFQLSPGEMGRAMSTAIATFSAARNKLQVVAAASVIAVAAAVPSVVANAEPAVPVPHAPTIQVLSEPILGPVGDIAQQPIPFLPGGGRVLIDAFGAVILVTFGFVLIPLIAAFEIIRSLSNFPGFFQPGPYGTGRQS